MVYQCKMFLCLYTQRKYYFHLITKAQMAFFSFNSNQVNYRSCSNKHRSALSFLPFRKTRYGMFFFVCLFYSKSIRTAVVSKGNMTKDSFEGPIFLLRSQRQRLKN